MRLYIITFVISDSLVLSSIPTNLYGSDHMYIRDVLLTGSIQAFFVDGTLVNIQMSGKRHLHTWCQSSFHDLSLVDPRS